MHFVSRVHADFGSCDRGAGDQAGGRPSSARKSGWNVEGPNQNEENRTPLRIPRFRQNSGRRRRGASRRDTEGWFIEFDAFAQRVVNHFGNVASAFGQR